MRCVPGVLKICLSVIACSCVGTFTKCLGVTSAQQICKHCQPVWIGAARFGQQRFDDCEPMRWLRLKCRLMRASTTKKTCQQLGMILKNAITYGGWVPRVHLAHCWSSGEGRLWLFHRQLCCRAIFLLSNLFHSWSSALKRQPSLWPLHLLGHFKELFGALELMSFPLCGTLYKQKM